MQDLPPSGLAELKKCLDGRYAGQAAEACGLNAADDNRSCQGLRHSREGADPSADRPWLPRPWRRAGPAPHQPRHPHRQDRQGRVRPPDHGREEQQPGRSRPRAVSDCRRQKRTGHHRRLRLRKRQDPLHRRRKPGGLLSRTAKRSRQHWTRSSSWWYPTCS